MRSRIIHTDNDARLPLPIIGKIKVGRRVNGIPQSLDYFIATGKYAALFHKACGEKPQSIRIVFPSDDAGKVCIERYEYRNPAGQLLAWGDGEIFKVWDGSRYVELSRDHHPDILAAVNKKYPNKCNNDLYGWQIRLRMVFIIPAVSGIVGAWALETNGHNSSIPGLRDIFDEMIKSHETLKNIEFEMSVEYRKSQKPGSISRYPVISMVPILN